MPSIITHLLPASSFHIMQTQARLSNAVCEKKCAKAENLQSHNRVTRCLFTCEGFLTVYTNYVCLYLTCGVQLATCSIKIYWHLAYANINRTAWPWYIGWLVQTGNFLLYNVTAHSPDFLAIHSEGLYTKTTKRVYDVEGKCLRKQSLNFNAALSDVQTYPQMSLWHCQMIDLSHLSNTCTCMYFYSS